MIAIAETFTLLASPRASADKTRVARDLCAFAEGAAADDGGDLPVVMRRTTRLLAQLSIDDDARRHLQLYAAACRTMLASVLEVRNFGRRAAHALFSLVENGLPSDALRDLGAGDRLRGPGDADGEVLLACSVVLALARLPAEKLPEVFGVALSGVAALAALTGGRRYREALALLRREVEPGALRGARLAGYCARLLAAAAGRDPTRTRRRAVRILEQKARYAMLHHGDHALGGRRLVEWFSDKPFRAEAMLEALYRSAWVDREDPGRSRLFSELAGRGGRMDGVFLPAELEVLARDFRFRSAGEEGGAPFEEPHQVRAPSGPVEELHLEPYDHRGRYFALLAADKDPGLAQATLEETFAELAALRRGQTGLFASFPYERSTVEERIAALYAYQAERVRAMGFTLDGEELRAFHRLFAPLGFVDGCWLRSAVVDRHESDAKLRLYRIYSDEVGNGVPAHNHANLYGELMGALGFDLRVADDLAPLALPKAAFKAPSFLLALDVLQADHFPELLGVTLAIELSGLDGLYETMIDNLEAQGYPAAYWRLHVSVDNLSTGHARQSLEAVLDHLDKAALEHGAALAAGVWERVWSGFLAMLYLFEGQLRLLAGAKKTKTTTKTTTKAVA